MADASDPGCDLWRPYGPPPGPPPPGMPPLARAAVFEPDVAWITRLAALLDGAIVECERIMGESESPDPDELGPWVGIVHDLREALRP